MAQKIGAQAVITTATDIGGRFSPDSFAAANHLLISDMTAAKQIAAAVLDGEKVGLHTAYSYRNLPPELTPEMNTRCGIVIAAEMQEAPFPVTLHLIPKNIVVGIGCKNNVSSEQIETAVHRAMQKYHIVSSRICQAASIDLKAQERGLIDFCARYKLPLKTYSAAELLTAEGDFTPSAFVKQITGIENVCERSAAMCGGSLIMRKYAENGVTVAAAELNV